MPCHGVYGGRSDGCKDPPPRHFEALASLELDVILRDNVRDDVQLSALRIRAPEPSCEKSKSGTLNRIANFCQTPNHLEESVYAHSTSTSRCRMHSSVVKVIFSVVCGPVEA